MAWPPSAVIFDLDGTLLDHEGSATIALWKWLPDLGACATDELIDAWFAAEERHFPAWRDREISFQEQRRRRLREFLPLIAIEPGPPDELDALFGRFLRCYESAWTAFDDVDAALIALRKAGIQTAVLTNGTTAQQKAKVFAIGLTSRLGPIFTAEELGVAKPHLAAYTEACRQLAIEPGDVLHVGDRYDVDVVAARAAGLHAAHLDRSDSGPHDEPHRMTSLTQLSDHLSAREPDED